MGVYGGDTFIGITLIYFDEKILIQNFVRKVARLGSCHAFSEVQVDLVVIDLFLLLCSDSDSACHFLLVVVVDLELCSESGSGCHFLLSRVGMGLMTLSTTYGGGDNLLTF